MIPELGRSCDVCIPPVHYLINCPACEHSWDEAPEAGEFACSRCSAKVVVSEDDHAVWKTYARLDSDNPTHAGCGERRSSPPVPMQTLPPVSSARLWQDLRRNYRYEGNGIVYFRGRRYLAADHVAWIRCTRCRLDAAAWLRACRASARLALRPPLRTPLHHCRFGPSEQQSPIGFG
jgi:DNA-directed RNA polymerase subunit RPC12/RpoP